MSGTFLPSTSTRPLCGFSRPTMCFSVTLLPVPDRPMITYVSPRRTDEVEPLEDPLPAEAAVDVLETDQDVVALAHR
jgi:hypothetical protein